MEEQLKQLDDRLTQLEQQLGGLSNDTRQVQVIRNAIAGTNLKTLSIEIEKDLNHDGTLVGFYGKAPVTQQASADNPSGGVTIDNEARSSINQLISRLDNLGLTA